MDVKDISQKCETFCLSDYLRNIWCSNFLQKIAESWPEQSVRKTCILSSAEIRFQPPGLVITERCGHSINKPNCILAPFNLGEYSCGRTSMKKIKNMSLCWLCCQDYKISSEDHTFVCTAQVRLFGSQRVSCFLAWHWATCSNTHWPNLFQRKTDYRHF